MNILNSVRSLGTSVAARATEASSQMRSFAGRLRGRAVAVSSQISNSRPVVAVSNATNRAFRAISTTFSNISNAIRGFVRREINVISAAVHAATSFISQRILGRAPAAEEQPALAAAEEQPAPAAEEQPAPAAAEEQPAPAAAEEQPAPAAEEQEFHDAVQEQPAPAAEEQPAPAAAPRGKGSRLAKELEQLQKEAEAFTARA